MIRDLNNGRRSRRYIFEHNRHQIHVYVYADRSTEVILRRPTSDGGYVERTLENPSRYMSWWMLMCARSTGHVIYWSYI